MKPTAGRAAARAAGVLAAATAAVAVAYASAFRAGGPPPWAAWLLALGVPAALVAMLVLGAARRGRVSGRLLAAFVATGVMLAGGFALALALPAGAGGTTAGEPLVLGLPRRAAAVVYGVGLLPALLLPVVYALTFDAETLTAEDLARVRAAAAAASGPSAPGSSAPGSSAPGSSAPEA